jgi:hypothetical protein
MFIDEKRGGEPHLAGFTAFVETKNPAEEYDWEDRTACACAQYARTIGEYEKWLQPVTDKNHLWVQLDKLSRLDSRYLRPPNRTYGELLERLRDAAVSPCPQV